jgi:hypothetical protein
MQRIGIGQAIVLAVLVALLIGTGIGAISMWNASSDVEMSTHGWIALGLGTFFSLIIGCGLMALIFYSSRYGYDDAVDDFRDNRRERAKWTARETAEGTSAPGALAEIQAADSERHRDGDR